MLIERVHIEDFRSIKALTVELASPQVIFEGKNDTGKSNIVRAIDLCLRHVAAEWTKSAGNYGFAKWPGRWGVRPEAIFRTGATAAKVEVTVRLSPRERVTEGKHERIKFNVRWQRQQPPIPTLVSFELAPGTQGLSTADKENVGELLTWAYRLVDAHRKPEDENFNANTNEPAEALPVWRGNNIKQLLFAFKNHPRPEVQERFEEFARRCADPDFPVGELTVGVSPAGRLFARTRQNGTVFELEDRSDGIQQLVALLALSVCHTGSIVAIEEPEAHLNEALQRTFWDKLQQLQRTDSGLEQVIVTSHSHVFELQADRIVVSRNQEGFTTATHTEPVVQGPPEYESLKVTRDGTLHLSGVLRELLGIESDGGLIYADTRNGSVRLLTSGTFAKETLGNDR